MMRSLLLISFLACSLISRSTFAQFTQPQWLEEWKRAKEYTKAYLDAMPEDGYTFKPTAEIRSFAQQMLHLADGNYLFGSMGAGKPSPFGQTLPQHDQSEKTIMPTKEATTKAVMDSYDFVISGMEATTAAQGTEIIKIGKRDISRSGMFAKAFEHQTHHRGQTTVYLRLKGIAPPPEQLF